MNKLENYVLKTINFITKKGGKISEIRKNLTLRQYLFEYVVCATQLRKSENITTVVNRLNEKIKTFEDLNFIIGG